MPSLLMFLNSSWIKPLAIAILTALVFFSGYHLRSLSAAKELTAQKADYEAQLSKIQLALATAKADAEAAARAIEQAHAKELSTIATKYEARIKGIKNENANVGIAISSDGLWIDVQYSTCRKRSTEIGTGASVYNGTTRCRLSDKAAQSLSALAYDADQVATQLQSAQEVIAEDRR
jgi:hypothetical protein